MAINANVLDAITRSAAIPSVPQVVTRFMQVIQDPEFKYDDLAKVLSADPGTVSEVLRLTNSALFGLTRKVTSLRQALTLLGPKRTRSLILGRYLVESVSKSGGNSIDSSYFWRRSLATAVLSSRLINMLAPRKRDEAFISGLLASIGIPVLADAFPSEYAKLAARYIPHAEPFTADEEMAAVGVTHREVSALILSHWGLPEGVCEAVRLAGNDPTTDAAAVATMARVIFASECIAALLCQIPDVDQVGGVCSAAMELIGIDLSALSSVLNDIEKDVEELATILRIDVIPSSVYHLIAKTIQEKLAAPVC